MAEPEGLLIDGARVAVTRARDLWWRVHPPTERPRLALERVRHRLELLLHALYDTAFQIVPSDPDPPPTWLARVLGRAPKHLVPAVALAGTDGDRVWLPRALDARSGEVTAMERYRLLAVAQAARAAHGFARARPHQAPRIERDLYGIAEAAAVDHRLAGDAPGLAGALQAARAAALATRPSMERLTPAEQAVERLVHGVLGAGRASAPTALDLVDTPAAALEWARREAHGLRAAGRYRGIAPVALWGEPRWPASSPAVRAGDVTGDAAAPPGRAAALSRAPRVRRPGADEQDAQPGISMVRLDDPMQSVEDPHGLQRPLDRDDAADPGDLGQSLSELPEASVVRTTARSREILHADGERPAPMPGDAIARDGAHATAYPEWDHRLGAYRIPGAIVRPAPAANGGDDWSQRVLARHASLVRQVRRRFEGLRPRRVRVGRQPDGDEIDLASYVAAVADRRAGASGEDALYAASLPARRDFALAVLADASASTDAWVSGTDRIVDVEKEALVVLLEALDALGDRHTVLAFSGQGPRDVRVLTLKTFEENARTARRRVGALEPDGYTRLGAAVRHASALLDRERARHRLLLVLSDGKPNDVDEYAGRYGIEDTRQAVAEARLAGIAPFCLTVDREAPVYLPSVFGPRGYAVLPRPERLPGVLVDVLRSLIAG
jgi:nitric oxide reductase NorD protein